MDILKNNKLIAEFMGFKVKEHGWLSDKETLHPTDIKYNISWDWLMPVVEKIESITIDIEEESTMAGTMRTMPNQFEVVITCNYCTINRGNGAEGMLDDFLELWDGSFEGTKLQATYKAVTEFIKWYNKSK